MRGTRLDELRTTLALERSACANDNPRIYGRRFLKPPIGAV
jgi:hypothetical protein